jgi:tRNA pseudouridine38-40 synthase
VKYAIGIEYSGAAYCGWQRQPHCDSIQQNLETALGFVANHPIDLVCAGRTDAGVHALEQVAHDIRLLWATAVADDFHARFSAVARAYRYIILNTAVPSALFNDRCSWEFRPLDHAAMHECAQILLGEHDFSAFRAVGCQAKSASRNLQEISVTRRDRLIFLDIRANAFLYHMVRNIAGSLMAVGKGEKDRDWFAQVFASRDRNQAEVTAPAAGLYFLQACYEDPFKLPTNARKPVLF